MSIHAEVTIDARADRIWNIITDIENATETISAIEEIDVLEKPEHGLVGLKWKETRTMFGKTATEVMWITDAAENLFYQTRAESHGAVYVSRLTLTPDGDRTRLSMDFGAEPQTFMAKLSWMTVGRLFQNATRKALVKDLEDIKALAEQGD